MTDVETPEAGPSLNYATHTSNRFFSVNASPNCDFMWSGRRICRVPQRIFGRRQIVDRTLQVRGHPGHRVIDVAALDHVEHRAVLGGHLGRRGPGRAQLRDAEADLSAERQIEAL